MRALHSPDDHRARNLGARPGLINKVTYVQASDRSRAPGLKKPRARSSSRLLGSENEFPSWRVAPHWTDETNGIKFARADIYGQVLRRRKAISLFSPQTHKLKMVRDFIPNFLRSCVDIRRRGTARRFTRERRTPLPPPPRHENRCRKLCRVRAESLIMRD